MERVKFSKEFIRNWIAMGSGKTEFHFKQNKRKRMPARTVKVTPSPWDKPSNRNYSVCGIINDKMVWCENGLTLDAVVTTVWAAAHGD